MKILFYLLFLSICLSCSKNSVDNENCKFLLNVGVHEPLNLNFYGALQTTPGTSIYLPNAGNGGIIVINVGFSYMAWDASDPNHIPSSCSVLSVSGFVATCGCEDGNKYDLTSGEPLQNNTLRCALKNYRVEQTGNTLLITN